MAISTLVDLVSTYGDEAKKLRELIELGSNRTNSGNTSFTSSTSSIVYDTSTSLDPLVLNKGEDGLLVWLTSLFTTDVPTGYGNCLITAQYLSDLIKGIQNSELVFASDGGGSDSYEISLSVAPTAYSVGQMFSFYANTQNTGAVTLNVNSLGAVPIKDVNGNDPPTGTILSGQIVSVIFDGTNFVIKSVCPLMNTTGSTLTSPIINTPTIRNWDGWISANETWVYASATTITVPSGAASKYQKGTRPIPENQINL